MILKTTHNLPAAAPELPDMAGSEARYAAWEGNDGTPFAQFMAAPSAGRRAFLRTLRRELEQMPDGTVRQRYLAPPTSPEGRLMNPNP